MCFNFFSQRMELIVWHSILDKYFAPDVMSVHFKASRPVLKKRGSPWNRRPDIDPNLVFSKAELLSLIDNIFAEIEHRDDAFLEIDKMLSKVVQLGPYRIVIVYPPLSDGLEMTIVKPTKRLTIEDYELAPELIDLFENKARWVLISWAPGSWKTTFAQALVDLYHQKNYIIKTIESPRDLLVSDDVAQYSFTYGGHDDLRDILLLSRPDYTIYDEVRNKPDFELYKDLRLTGIGLVGVIHATKPVDSIQRFLGSIEMGIIPQVIDTVVYISGGKITEILQLRLTVKVPEGMQSADLARPVIQITSFFTGELQYEIYSFGEQIVVVPIQDIANAPESKITQYAQEAVTKKLATILPCPFIAQLKWLHDVNIYIPRNYKPTIIGRGWKNIIESEKDLGLHINVSTFDELPVVDTSYKVRNSTKKQKMSIQFSTDFAKKKIALLSNDELHFFTIGEDGLVVVHKQTTANSLEKNGFLVIDPARL